MAQTAPTPKTTKPCAHAHTKRGGEKLFQKCGKRSEFEQIKVEIEQSWTNLV